LADALLNVVLFAPFGAVLSLRFPARTRIATLIRLLSMSFLASITIELLQF
jgi:glycopeptide antibiotics resistance protein